MLPLVYIGAGLAGLYAGVKLTEKWQKDRGEVAVFPGESTLSVKPIDGSVVCCGVYEVLEHTGVWVENKVIERNGDGLVRAISSERFLQERSGDTIYVACNEFAKPLACLNMAEKAVCSLYQYSPYHLLNNNCHRFVIESLGYDVNSVRFVELNMLLSKHFAVSVHWYPIA